MHAYDNFCNDQSTSSEVTADWLFKKLVKLISDIQILLLNINKIFWRCVNFWNTSGHTKFVFYCLINFLQLWDRHLNPMILFTKNVAKLNVVIYKQLKYVGSKRYQNLIPYIFETCQSYFSFIMLTFSKFKIHMWWYWGFFIDQLLLLWKISHTTYGLCVGSS